MDRAIACFRAQRYAPKELLIAADYDFQCSVPGVRVLRVPRALSIGEKRNVLCEQARGSVIAHWDDDDWSHPDRLSEQVGYLASGHKVTGYDSIPFEDQTDGQVRLYKSSGPNAVGTSLTYYKAYWAQVRFKPFQVGEDVDFIKRSIHVLHYTSGVQRMVASTHAKNTSPRNHRQKTWQTVDRSTLPEGYESLANHSQ